MFLKFLRFAFSAPKVSRKVSPCEINTRHSLSVGPQTGVSLKTSSPLSNNKRPESLLAGFVLVVDAEISLTTEKKRKTKI
jgi:hypothetical protein